MEITTPTSTATQYAGFWLRLGALIIDGIIIGIVQFIIIFPMLTLMGVASFSALQNIDGDNMSNEEAMAILPALIGSVAVIWMASLVVQWLYYALMESSAKQATLGKMAVGIRVTDMNGNRISFMRASGRYFGKILSALIMCVGYLMAAFTEKKQALHDLMSGCLVVRSTNY